MLNYTWITYKGNADVLRKLEGEVVSHVSSLKINGLLARLHSVVTTDLHRGTVTLGGILTNPDAMSAAEEVSCIQARKRKLAGLSIEPPTVEVCEVTSSEDDYYADYQSAAGVELSCDIWWGLSPFVCAESGGFIADYLVPIVGELVAEVSDWDTCYRHIYAMWQASGSYEDWARKELFEEGSWLNTQGRKIAAQMEQQLGKKCTYEILSLATDID